MIAHSDAISFPLACERKDGTSVTFQVEVSPDETKPSVLHVYVKPDDAQMGAEFYYAALERVDSETVQSVVLHNFLPNEYHGLSLSARLIPQLALRLRARIRSSRRASSLTPHELQSGTVDDRNPLADLVWNSLVSAGLANYLEADDRYYHPPREVTE